MKALIMYPVGLLLKAYMAYANLLIWIKARKGEAAQKPAMKMKSTKVNHVVLKKEDKLQTA